MVEVNPKNVLSKRSDQENEEDGSHSSKKIGNSYSLTF